MYIIQSDCHLATSTSGTNLLSVKLQAKHQDSSAAGNCAICDISPGNKLTFRPNEVLIVPVYVASNVEVLKTRRIPPKKWFAYTRIISQCLYCRTFLVRYFESATSVFSALCVFLSITLWDVCGICNVFMRPFSGVTNAVAVARSLCSNVRISSQLSWQITAMYECEYDSCETILQSVAKRRRSGEVLPSALSVPLLVKFTQDQ